LPGITANGIYQIGGILARVRHASGTLLRTCNLMTMVFWEFIPETTISRGYTHYIRVFVGANRRLALRLKHRVNRRVTLRVTPTEDIESLTM